MTSVDLLPRTVLVALVFLLSTAGVQAAIISWDGNALIDGSLDGIFGDSVNWFPNQVPGGSDTALFDTAGSYTISFSLSGPAATDVLRVTDGSVKFQKATVNGDDIYNLTGNAEIVGGDLALGTFSLVSIPMTLNVGDNLVVHDGSLLSVLFGSDVTVTNQLSIAAGGAATGDGAVTVSGSGSTLDALASLVTIGDFGNTGTLTVLAGASTNLATTSAMLKVGDSASDTTVGNLSVESGGTVNTGNILIATNASLATGTITVDGTNSLLEQTLAGATLTLGSASGGAGTINVQNGGTFTASTGTTTVRATGTINVQNGGTFTAGTGTAAVNVFGTINIQNGGIYTAGTGTTTVGALGMINVGTALLAGGTFNASVFNIDGTLNVLNGGDVFSTTSKIGKAAGSTGSATIDGPGSTWMTSDLVVGHIGNGALNIQNGGMVSSTTGSLGNFSSTTGTVTIDDAGSAWTISGDLRVGQNGHGELIIQNGGAVSNSIGKIGNSGIVSVAGSGSTWTNSSDLRVGDRGVGTLNITGGGQVFNSGGGFVGYQISNVGIVTVADPNSTWTSPFGLDIGFDGFQGILNVNNGGTISSGLSNIGTNLGTKGTVTVDGAGSTWTSPSALRVGNDGNGTLNITNGGAVSFTNVGIIAAGSGSTSMATVDGVGSIWTMNTLRVGLEGIGTLNITQGGAVSDAFGLVGQESSSFGTVTIDDIDDLGSTWTNMADLFVGDFGDGTLIVTNGGTVSNVDGFIGNALGSTGTATIDGANGSGNLSTWTNTNTLKVGNLGTGTLMVTGGGTVSDVDGFIGDALGSTGTATVDGTDGASNPSTWTNTNTLTVGNLGNGTLNVTGGGLVSSIDGEIGSGANSISTATVDGAGSTWMNTGTLSVLTVGNLGNGTLNIQNGGTVSGSIGVVGSALGSTGMATVNGPGSTWTNTIGVVVGNTGNGTLDVTSGGTVTNTGQSSVGFSTGSTGTVTVDGDDGLGNPSTWTNSGNLSVGVSGNATLNIQNGGVVSSNSGFIGTSTGSTGNVTVNGTGSTWTMSSSMGVGSLGTGTLNIQNGGTVSTGGAGIASTGVATVEDIGSLWTNSNALNVNGTLSILNGGTVFSIGSDIGSGASSTGAVTINSAVSTWTNIGQLVVARAGTGSLTITDNATVTTGSAAIGNSTGSTGNLTVTNGLFDNTFSMFVGGSDVLAGGSGTLTVETLGLVDVGFTLTVWGPGTVQLNGGTIQALNVVMNGGTFNFNSGTLNYTQDLAAAPGDELSEVLGVARTIGAGRILKVDGNMTVAPLTTLTLAGGTLNTGGLTHEGDLLGSSGTSQVFGPVNLIGSGRVEANSGNFQFNGPVDHNGAEIQVAGGNQVVFSGNVTGAGNFTDGGLVRFEADYSAGNSAAEISFGGDIEFGPGANLDIEIGGINTGVASDFDRLLVGGAATLDGALAVTLINNFRQSINGNDTFVLMDTVSGISGNWANIVNGQRIGLTSGTGDFLVSYGAGSAFEPTQLVLSDFTLPIFIATLSGTGDWTTASWIFESATPVPPAFPNDDFDLPTMQSSTVARSRSTNRSRSVRSPSPTARLLRPPAKT